MAKIQKNFTRFKNYSIQELLEFSTGITAAIQFIDFEADTFVKDNYYHISRLLDLQKDINKEVAARLPMEILEEKEE